MRALFRVLMLAVALAAVPAAAGVTVPPPFAGGPPPPPTRSWAQAQIALVTSHGLMGGSVTRFRPNAVLTQGALSRLVAGLSGKDVLPPATPATPVTIAQLDAALVHALALDKAAGSFIRVVRAAELGPPSRFGTEVVVRLLALRMNHPTSADNLELLPSQPATRAEAAYSAARILTLGPTQVADVKAAASAFTLPAFSAWQRRILHTAVHFIGYPYVYGGTSETTEAPFGVRAPGGFDCSGFAWRVYKLQTYPNARRLTAVLKGRTTYEMSGEVGRAKRISFRRLQPADVIFFGADGTKSAPSEVGHMGIYVAGGWFIHSSSQGVALAQLQGWYRHEFAWGRRPLAEAGL